MPTLNITTPDGVETTISAENDLSIMEAIVAHELDGVEAICGGAMACATCHVIFEQDSFDRVGPPPDNEVAMLELNDQYSPTSRLSCQIKMDPSLDGLTLRIPEEG